jgi:hypothetical protein
MLPGFTDQTTTTTTTNQARQPKTRSGTSTNHRRCPPRPFAHLHPARTHHQRPPTSSLKWKSNLAEREADEPTHPTPTEGERRLQEPHQAHSPGMEPMPAREGRHALFVEAVPPPRTIGHLTNGRNVVSVQNRPTPPPWLQICCHVSRGAAAGTPRG